MTVLDVFAPGDAALIRTGAFLRAELGDIVTVQVTDPHRDVPSMRAQLAIRVVLDDSGYRPTLLWIMSRYYEADGNRPAELYYFTHPAMGRFEADAAHGAGMTMDVVNLVKRLRDSVEPGKPLLSEEYAMFSDEGNSIIRKAIMDAFADARPTTATEIGKVATAAGHNEGTDTAVREAIWAELERLNIAADY